MRIFRRVILLTSLLSAFFLAKGEVAAQRLAKQQYYLTLIDSSTAVVCSMHTSKSARGKRNKTVFRSALKLALSNDQKPYKKLRVRDKRRAKRACALAVKTDRRVPVNLTPGSIQKSGASSTLREEIACADLDLNGNGTIDVTDVGILLEGFNTSGPVGDVDSDGMVDLADLTILLSRFGETCVAEEFCPRVGSAWHNEPMVPQNGIFVVEFDALADAANVDGVIGLSDGPADWYTDLAVTVRLNQNGTFDARNGPAYQAENTLQYEAGIRYRIRLTVNLSSHRYSASVIPDGGIETVIATNFAFRTEQSGSALLTNVAAVSSIGSIQLCPSTISGSTGNHAPIANAGPDVEVADSDGNGEEAIVLDGTGSNDPDGTIINYRWTEGSVLLAEGTLPTAIVNLSPGVHTITLTVTDDGEATASDTVVVRVLEGEGGGGSELQLFVSPLGSGARDGLSLADSMSIAQASAHASQNPGIASTYLLLSGNYGAFTHSNPNTALKTFRAAPGGSPFFTRINIGGSGIVLDGVTVNASGVTTNVSTVSLQGSNLALRNCLVEGRGRHTAGVETIAAYGNNITVENCDVSLGHIAIQTGGTDITIRNNHLHRTSATTLRIYGMNGGLIEGNRIHDSRHETAVAAYCNGTGPLPEWGVPCSGTYACDPANCNPNYGSQSPHENFFNGRGIRNTIIRGNRMYDSAVSVLRVRDGESCNNTDLYSGENIIIENNIVDGLIWAASGEITLRNNVTNSVLLGYLSGACTPSIVNEFANNIIINDFGYYTTGSGATNWTGAYNDYNIIGRRMTWIGADVGPNTLVYGNSTAALSLFVDPFHPDPAQRNYRLRPDAVAIDFGPVNHAAVTDASGSGRIDIEGRGGDTGNGQIADAGAYEFGTE